MLSCSGTVNWCWPACSDLVAAEASMHQSLSVLIDWWMHSVVPVICTSAVVYVVHVCCVSALVPYPLFRMAVQAMACVCWHSRCTAVQCESKISPEVFWHFFPNDWEVLVQILHACYTFLSTLDCKFLFSYLQLWLSYAILHHMLKLSNIGRNARWVVATDLLIVAYEYSNFFGGRT